MYAMLLPAWLLRRLAPNLHARAAQMRADLLSLPPHLRRDIGLPSDDGRSEALPSEQSSPAPLLVMGLLLMSVGPK